MVECIFDLNDKPMSALKFGAQSFDAFSGDGKKRNQRRSICIANSGPIPIGTYHLIDRIAGGRAGPIYDLAGKVVGETLGHYLGIYQADWFALYALDSKLNDEIFCDMVRRGEFHLQASQ